MSSKSLRSTASRIGEDVSAGSTQKTVKSAYQQKNWKSTQGKRMNAYTNQAQQKQTQAQGTSGGGASTYDPYLAQANALYEQLMNRGPFRWDMQGDDVYRQYEDMYTNAGKLAMKDTMGTAAGMTGGYGNSYAALAGNQAYQSYLTQLAGTIPQLEERAYQRWLNEGDDLMNQYNLALSRAGTTGGTGTAAEEQTTASRNIPYTKEDIVKSIANANGLNADGAGISNSILFDYFNKYWNNK